MVLLGDKANFPARISNALVGPVSYLGMAFWPHRMAVLYPFRNNRPLWQPLAAAAGCWRRLPWRSSGRFAAAAIWPWAGSGTWEPWSR